MNELFLFFFFIFGLLFGSFYNVVGLRIPKKESIIYPNSHCTNCQHELSWYENIPVLSYLLLRGKCKQCKTKISWIYPVMEAVTGLLFTLAFYKFGFTWELALALLLVSLLVIITVSDLAYMLIPDKILLFFLVPIIIFRFIQPLEPWWDSLLGAALGFGILYLLAIVSKGGMGGGDIKLYFVLGIVLGTSSTLLSLFLASLIGSVFGIIQMLLQKFKKRTPIPFGPFISAGALIAYFYGEALINWYLTLY